MSRVAPGRGPAPPARSYGQETGFKGLSQHPHPHCVSWAATSEQPPLWGGTERTSKDGEERSPDFPGQLGVGWPLALPLSDSLQLLTREGVPSMST